MATRVRLRRGTTAQHDSFTGVEGEVTVDTDKKTVVVHDGSTAGGHDLLRADASRGWIRSEHFLNNGSWTKNNKTDLKRIEVHTWGGGGGGGSSAYESGGGSGGYGYRVIEVSDINTANVTVTVGTGGAAGSAGVATTFGSYITANGGSGGGSTNGAAGGAGGNVSGTNVRNMGSFVGLPGDGSARSGAGGGPGGGDVHSSKAAEGYQGGGGAATQAGAQGSILIYEIYGEA